jgi:hypothetical protein
MDETICVKCGDERETQQAALDDEWQIDASLNTDPSTWVCADCLEAAQQRRS